MNQLKEDIVLWIKEWFDKNGDENTPAVIGISGGKDSSVVAALCVEALGPERVIGVLMPSGSQADIADSIQLVEHLGIRSVEINIGPMYEMAILNLNYAVGMVKNPLVKGNLQARLRMTTLYAVSQERNGRVSNNCNASERFVGYSTIYGDDAGDFSPISSITSKGVMLLGRELGLPDNLWAKTPIDGLENNSVKGNTLTDEDVMGFTYDQLDEFMLSGMVMDDKDAGILIYSKHEGSRFKRRLPRIPHFKMEIDDLFKVIDNV